MNIFATTHQYVPTDGECCLLCSDFQNKIEIRAQIEINSEFTFGHTSCLSVWILGHQSLRLRLVLMWLHINLYTCSINNCVVCSSTRHMCVRLTVGVSHALIEQKHEWNIYYVHRTESIFEKLRSTSTVELKAVIWLRTEVIRPIYVRPCFLKSKNE